MPNCVAWLVTSGRPIAGTTRLAPGRTTIVRPASVSSRRRSTRISWSPSRSLIPSRSCDRAVDPRAVDPRAVAGAGVLDRGRLAAVARDPRVHARDRRVLEHHGRARRPADRHLGHDRHPRPVAQHQLERRDVPRPRRAAAEAEAAPSIELAPAARAEHRYCPSVSGWKTGLSPLKPTSVWFLRVLDREAHERADRLLAVLVGLHDHERLAVAAPRDLAGAHRRSASRSSAGSRPSCRGRAGTARRPGWRRAPAASRRASTPRRARPRWPSTCP